MVSETALPARIERLSELAHNMWWSWHHASRTVFRSLDYPLWSLTGHNPAKMLHQIDPIRLRLAARDPEFLEVYDKAIAELDKDLLGNSNWFQQSHPEHRRDVIAYFSAEFAIHNSLPIYAGGLGILAGDLLKEASDLGLPMVGVGLMYPQGYFQQHIGPDGWQQEVYRELDFRSAPISPVRMSPDATCAPLTSVRLGSRSVQLGAYLVRVGRVELYLVCTDVDGNSPEDRQLTSRLYTAEQSRRIQQEIVLGIGGTRILKAIGIEPTVWHANEGHTAFMMMERIRGERERGRSPEDALDAVRARTVFTTHTPVPAGHDVFSFDLMDEHFSGYWDLPGADRSRMLELGRTDGSAQFNMTTFALRTSARSNAVSKKHMQVTQRMWQGLWPDTPEDLVPISHVTNGVHPPTWLSAELAELYCSHLGHDWAERHDDIALWDGIDKISDDALWQARRKQKQRLITAMALRGQECWASGRCSPQQALAMGSLFEPTALTIGFVRRFTEYKRPTLLFRDIERLKRIVRDPWCPVQIVFAGKSHPADEASKQLLQQVYRMCLDREFRGRVAFVEDYDMHMSRLLTRGVDVWLNTPRRPREASGTSGMKACMNGVIHLSVPDGWWPEGYDGTNGWVIGDETLSASHEEEDSRDADALYSILENEVIPLFYDRDRNGIPHGWLKKVRSSIKSITPRFSSRRMVKDYVGTMYIPVLEQGYGPQAPR
ncbi:MAG: alpha-glucan family phosphorylase [Dehalococcoidia bacterium]|jgi:starch phosphorylase|nr:alpha-glucan family phosphorylase [Dehalococcoidia bacterium]